MAKKLEYQALLEEEKLTLEDLPMEIRKRINVLKPLIAKFNDNPTDKMKQAIIKNDVEIAEMIADFIEKDLPEQNDDDDDNNNNVSKKSKNRKDDDDDDDAEGNDDNDSDNNGGKSNKKVKQQQQQPAVKTPEQIEAEKAARQAEIDKAAEEKIAAQKKAAEEKAEADRLAAEEEQNKKDAAKKPITSFGTLEMEKKITENCEKNNGFISEKDLISIIGKSPDYPNQKVFSISLKKVFLKSLYQLV